MTYEFILEQKLKKILERENLKAWEVRLYLNGYKADVIRESDNVIVGVINLNG
jgi:hypothetical protein